MPKEATITRDRTTPPSPTNDNGGTVWPQFDLVQNQQNSGLKATVLEPLPIAGEIGIAASPFIWNTRNWGNSDTGMAAFEESRGLSNIMLPQDQGCSGVSTTAPAFGNSCDSSGMTWQQVENRELSLDRNVFEFIDFDHKESGS